MNFKFKDKNLSGEIKQSIWTGRGKLFIKNKEIIKKADQWVLSDGTTIKEKLKWFIFPQLEINGKIVDLINLKPWELVFVCLPGLLFFFFGVIPAMISMFGVYVNLNIFLSQRFNNIFKIVLSLFIFISCISLMFGILLLISTS